MSDPEESPEAGTETPVINSKVGRVIEEYALDGAGAWLETHWTGDGVERRSLRDLADAFNRRVLRATMREAGMDSLETDVESAYRLLTDDDASSGARVELRNELEWNGVDVEAVESDFVSHQAVHTYLRKVRDAEREEPDVDPREKELGTIQRLQGRTRVVTTDSLERLAKQGELTLDGFDVLVDVRVVCDRCGSQYPVADLLTQGGCECH
jgi:hypothetical protein